MTAPKLLKGVAGNGKEERAGDFFQRVAIKKIKKFPAITKIQAGEF